MRASFILLGPLLTRFGRVIISNPGGDRIGRRPVDLHVDAMRALGADDRVPQRLLLRDGAGPAARRPRSRFPFVSVMGTENAMLAATLAEGHTVIRPAAQEPEVDDLIAFLQKMGAEVERTVPGHDRGRGPQAPARRRAPRHRRTASRPARSSSRRPSPAADVTLEGAPCDHLGAFLDVARAGRRRRRRAARDTIEVDGAALARRRLPGRRHRDRAVPGPRHRPPAADVACC